MTDVIEKEDPHLDKTPINPAEVVLSFSPSDDPRVAAYSMATNLKSIFHFYTQAGDISPCWMYQEHKGIWVSRGKELIEEVVTRSMSQFFKSRILSETTKIIRFSTRDETVTLGSMTPNKIVMANGVFDMDTGEFSPDFNHLDYQLMALPYDYDVNADCPRFKQFLEEICNDEDDRHALVEFMGYCLVHHHRIHTFLVLVGNGENGKSKFCGVLETMLGEDNISGMTIQELAHDRFMAAELQDKLANICPDIPDAPIKVTGRIKSLTGQDTIQVQKKHQTSFPYKNHAKLLFSANQIPKVDDMADAWFRRVRIIEFPNQFLVHDAKRDENLGEKLDAEVQGIFNLAVEGWQRLKDQGKFSGSKSTEDNRRDYLKRSDPLQYFVYRFCQPDLESMITVEAAFHCYKLVSHNLGKVPISKEWFSRRFVDLMENVEIRQKKINGKNTKTYVGLKIDLEILQRETGNGIDSIVVYQGETLRDIVYIFQNGINADTDSDQQKLPDDDASDGEEEIQIAKVDVARAKSEKVVTKPSRDKGYLLLVGRLADFWNTAGLKPDESFKDEDLEKVVDNGFKHAGQLLEESTSVQLVRSQEPGQWWLTKTGQQEIKEVIQITGSKEPEKPKFPRLKRDRTTAIQKLFVTEGQTLSRSDILQQLTETFGSGFEDKISETIDALMQSGVLMEPDKPGVYTWIGV